MNSSNQPASDEENVVLLSNLRCPVCGHTQAETMPTDFCLITYTCLACGAVLQPQSGDCCVFCSYGDVRCPPQQQGAQVEA
ncbi:MAG: GDCCVxC domain-containing (seleno)protein [Ktedonobacterales bacterium]